MCIRDSRDGEDNSVLDRAEKSERAILIRVANGAAEIFTAHLHHQRMGRKTQMHQMRFVDVHAGRIFASSDLAIQLAHGSRFSIAIGHHKLERCGFKIIMVKHFEP